MKGSRDSCSPPSQIMINFFNEEEKMGLDGGSCPSDLDTVFPPSCLHHNRNWAFFNLFYEFLVDLWRKTLKEGVDTPNFSSL